MKTKLTLAFCACILAFGAPLRAETSDTSTEEKLLTHFFTPELIKRSATMLGMKGEQVFALLAVWEDGLRKIADAEEKLQQEADKFNDLAKQRHVDGEALAVQGDKVLDMDREVKHAQLSMLVRIKNMLTPEQQATLNGVKSLDTKIRQVQLGVDRWRIEGRDLGPVKGTRIKIEELLKNGKMDEARELVEHVLKILSGDIEK